MIMVQSKIEKPLFILKPDISNAIIPKIIDGIVKDKTTPATAIFDFDKLKTTIRSIKFKRFMAN